jgi:hypothetical protein
MAGSAAVMAAGLGTGLVAYYAGGFEPVSASAVSNELRYVPADAALVAYADVRTIMDSELRQQLKQSMPIPEKGQQEFQSLTGIDIERDIDFVVAAVTSASVQTAPLVIARGRFNDVQLESLAREHGGTVEDYKGKRLLLINDHQAEQTDTVGAIVQNATHHMALAFLEPGLVAVGQAAAVKNAIDAQLTAHSITSNNEMMELVSDIGATNNAWAVGRFDLLSAHAKLPDQIAAQIPPVKWFAVAGHINGGVSGTLRAEARDDESAERLRKMLNGLLAFGEMSAQSDPRAKLVMDSLQLSGTGKTVSLSFSVPPEVLQLLPKAAAQH